MPGERHRERTVWASSAVVALLFLVLFWRLGTPTFWDPDEAHYAETTREMLDTRDWMAPHYNDAPFFDKPILFHWLQGISMAAVGRNELGARVTPALAALALIGLTAWIGGALRSIEAGRLGALFLATNPATFGLARYAILDSLFTAFLFGGAGLVTISAVQQRPRLQWGGYLLIALAVLTKGPLALVLCGLTFGLVLLASPELRRRLLALRWLSGLVLVIATSAPWFVYMAWRFGVSFYSGYLLDENIKLYATDRFTPTASSSVWFYFRVLAAGMLPWTAIVVGRLYDDVRAIRRDGSLDDVDVLLWSWAITLLGFFTLSRFKLDHYIFPAAPALCLICARAWLAVREHPDDPRHAGARIGVWLVGPLLIVVAIAGGFLQIARLALPAAALIVPAAVGAAGVVITAQMNLRGRRPRIPWAVIGALTALYTGVLIWVLPALEQRKVVPDIARWVAARALPTDRVASFQLNRWNTAFRFYVNRHVAMIDAPDEARQLFATERSPVYCVMLRPAYEEFVNAGVPLQVVYEREGMWATSGRVLWRRETPLTHFVVVTQRPR